VGDGDKAYAACLNFGKQYLPYLRLGDEVKHGGDFIGDYKAYRWGKGTGYAKTLEFPAGQFPGVTSEPCGFYTQSLKESVPGIPPFGKNIPHLEAGVYGGFGVLQDQLHRITAFPKDRPRKYDFALPRFFVMGKEFAQRGFSGAAVPQEGDPAAAFKRKIHPSEKPRVLFTGLIPTVAKAHIF
jgi:hypothetical protein